MSQFIDDRSEYDRRIARIMEYASQTTLLTEVVTIADKYETTRKSLPKGKEIFVHYEWDQNTEDGLTNVKIWTIVCEISKRLFFPTVVTPNVIRLRGYCIEKAGGLFRWEFKDRKNVSAFHRYQRRIGELYEELGAGAGDEFVSRQKLRLVSMFTQHTGRRTTTNNIDRELPLEPDFDWKPLDGVISTVLNSYLTSDGQEPKPEELIALRSKAIKKWNTSNLTEALHEYRSAEKKDEAKRVLTHFLRQIVIEHRQRNSTIFKAGLYHQLSASNNIHQLLTKSANNFVFGNSESSNRPSSAVYAAEYLLNTSIRKYIIDSVTEEMSEIPVAVWFCSTNYDVENALTESWQRYKRQDRSKIIIFTGPYATGQGKTAFMTTWRSIFASVDLPSHSESFWSSGYDPEQITTIVGDDVTGNRLDWGLLKRVASGTHTINIKHCPEITNSGRKPMIFISKNDTSNWSYDPESQQAIADRVCDIVIPHRFNVVWIVAFQTKNTTTQNGERGGGEYSSCGRIATCIASVDPEDEDTIPLVSFSTLTHTNLEPFISEITAGDFNSRTTPEYDRLHFLIDYIKSRADRYTKEGLPSPPPPPSSRTMTPTRLQTPTRLPHTTLTSSILKPLCD